MPRQPRKLSSTNIYHVVVKGNNSQLLFEENHDYLKYLEILEYQKEKCDFKLFAYCLMSNHVHLLIRTNSVALDSIFRKINTAYANWFNMKYCRTGPIQDGRYYSEPVDSPEYLLSAVRYIHKNPLNAGLENQIGSNFIWTSYPSYINKPSELVDTDLILCQFADINDFINFHSFNNNDIFIDINNVRKRMPDDVATCTINKMCNIAHPDEIAKFSLLQRREAIYSIHEKGISSRQISRLTGIPLGVINRILF